MVIAGMDAEKPCVVCFFSSDLACLVVGLITTQDKNLCEEQKKIIDSNSYLVPIV